MKEDKYYRLFSFLLDFLVFSASFTLADAIGRVFFKEISNIETHWLIYFLVIISYLFFSTRFKTRDLGHFGPGDRPIRGTLKSLMMAFLVTAFIILMFPNYFVSRAFFLLFFFLSALTVPASRPLTKQIYYYFRKKEGKVKKYVLMVGADFAVRKLVKSIEDEVVEKYQIIGFATYEPMNKSEFLGYKILGEVKDIDTIIADNVVDMIILFPNSRYMEQSRDIIKTCEIEGMEVFVYSDIFDLSFADMSILKYSGTHIIKFSSMEKEPYMLLLKRFVDILGSAVLILLTLPVQIITALAILVENGFRGPIFYSQFRCGLNGRKFRMFKFRSMIDGADRLKDKLAHRNEAQGPVFKVKDDPRITKVGAFIRKFSIDELPQLYNVFIGDMSLVGPRPPLPLEVKKYDRWHRRRLSMKPGITCIWQVSGRSNISFERWVEMDLEYIDKWSILLDFQLLLKTLPAVITGRGAY